MKRNELINKAKSQNNDCDILVIGGGATGLGVALDAASRGFRTILLEQHDFAKGTSSRSTKLVHGGVRYLAQGDVQLVVHALHERGRMRMNAPHLVKDMRFIIGNYRWWERPFYSVGLVLYDLLAGQLGLGRSRPLSKKRVSEEIPGLAKNGLRGGVVYHDGQFDDARLAISLAQTAVNHGAVCLNYMEVSELTKNDEGVINGVVARDVTTDEVCSFTARSVINATGVFVDRVMKMDEKGVKNKVRPSQGIHLVVDHRFLNGDSALMIPKTDDGRVLFGVPWHGKVVLGTTDTPLNDSSLEPRALESEVDFILDQAGQYLTERPTRADVLSVFAGLRPLAAPTNSKSTKTKEISRSHKIYTSSAGLITITGGKWTTYREMGQDAVDRSIALAGLDDRQCVTEELKIHGYCEDADTSSWDYVYGSDIVALKALVAEDGQNGDLLHKEYTFNKAHVVWAVREEMALTLEDVLARRVRMLFLDARAAIDIAPTVAAVMAKEMGKDKEWEKHQIEEFISLARGYIL